jgi:hypothetical protein
MLLQRIAEVSIRASRYPWSAHYHDINIRQLFTGQSETLTNQAFYPVAVYCPTGALFGYSQPKTSRLTAIVAPKNSKAGIGGLSWLLKDPREILGGEQPQISREPRLSCWQ